MIEKVKKLIVKYNDKIVGYIAELEDERIARLASERSLAIAKEAMRHDKAIKKVFGGDK